MILAIGDSFTYGSELPDRPMNYSVTTHLPPSKFAWPSLLAKKLNTQVDNLSLPGASNSRTFRLATTTLVKNKYDILLCGWSELSRLDIKYQDRDFPVTVNSGKWFQKELPWIDDYYRLSYNENHAAETWLAQLITLQDFFKYNNQRYLFCSMQGLGILPGFLGVETITKFTEFASRIDQKYYIDWPNGGMVDWMADCPKGPGGHPLELGHERIADKIYEHIRSLGWLS